MRLRRIELTNVRGISHREVVLLDGDASTGVTIVEGPNESGKSTLADALDALLSYKATSQHRHVKSLKPAHRDEDPEVTAEISAGDYRFVYSKRYAGPSKAATQTRLSVHAPRPEQHTGDEAHDRVKAILDETTDLDLWEALRLPQGAGLDQAPLGGATGLAATLEQRTGTSALGERELGLLEAARAEYERYFTEGGNERKHPIREAREYVTEVEAELASVDERIASLERDVERADTIERDLPRRREHATESRRRAREFADERVRIDELRAEVERRERELATAQAEAERLSERLAARRKLADELAEAEEAQRGLAARREEVERLLAQATQRLEHADAELEATRERQRRARAARERAQADLDHLRARDELSGVHRRLEQATAARDRRREAEARAHQYAVDDELLAELRAAQSALDRAQAALDAASPEVTFRAASATTITAAPTATADEGVAGEGDTGESAAGDSVSGGSEDVAAGEERHWTVHGALTLTLGEVGEVTVRSGGGTEEPATAHADAQRRRDELLERAGVDDLDAAEEAHRERRDALAEAAEAARALERALDGEALDALDDRAARLAQQVDGYLAERGEDPPLPGDLDEAQRVLDEAVEAERRADASVTGPQAQVEAARAAVEAQRREEIETRTSASEVERRCASLSAELTAAREQLGDDALGEQAEAAERTRAEAVATLERARAELAAADPDTVVAQADNASEVADRAEAELAESEQELRDLRTRIATLGGEGLHESREDLLTRLTHARADLDSLLRRAAAAKMLFETLERHRAAAFERHATPLREQLVRFGRMLHGPDFDVELDDDLRVVTRHLDGVTLAVDQLSVGAQEQLALLGRLAAAVLLADEGGVLLFDDALGNTDPERLEAAGAALRLAGEHCQVVVLTCYPDRYRHVGNAHRVVLA